MCDRNASRIGYSRERLIEKLRAGTLATHLSDGESAADHVPWAASIWIALPDPLFSCLFGTGGMEAGAFRMF
jgi:hypothetical protein